MIKMTVKEALKTALPQDIELTDIKEFMARPRTKEDILAEVEALKKIVAKRRGCEVSDLEWRRDRFGAIHIRKKNGQKNSIQS